MPETETKKPPGMTAQEFKELLRAAGMNYPQAAELLCVSRGLVSRWGAGIAPIPARAAAHIRLAIRKK